MVQTTDTRLEKLCRYGMRSSFAQSRLSLTEDGQVRYELKKPWPTPAGVSVLHLDPITFLSRLACLIPPPWAHMVRYHGVFAPNANARPLLPRPLPSAEQTPWLEGEAQQDADDDYLCPPPRAPEPRTILWARLIERVWKVDVLSCSLCGGRRRIIAFITKPSIITKILDHLGLPATPPAIAPARGPPVADLFDIEDLDDDTWSDI